MPTSNSAQYMCPARILGVLYTSGVPWQLNKNYLFSDMGEVSHHVHQHTRAGGSKSPLLALMFHVKHSIVERLKGEGYEIYNRSV